MIKRQKKKITLGVLIAVTAVAIPVATVSSCGISEMQNRDYGTFYQFSRTIINKYGPLNTLDGQRQFDMNFTNGNAIQGYRLYSSALVLPLMRYKAVGKNTYKINLDLNDKVNGGKVTWDKDGQKEEIEFSGIASLKGSVDGTTWTDIQPKDIKSGMASYKKYKFKIKENVFWTNYQNQKTNYKLTARDYFYGWVRSLLSMKTVREEGRLDYEKKGTTPLKSLMFSKGVLGGLNPADSGTNNRNAYMYDMFGLDVEKTLEDGNKLKKDDSEWTISLKNANNKAILSLFTGNSAFSPAPSQKITELANGRTTPEVKYGITTYGGDGAGTQGFKKMLSVSPYFYDYFNFIKGFRIVKNKHYWDKNFVNDKTRITQFFFHATPPQDEQAMSMARKSGYENGLESIFNKKAWKNTQVQRNVLENANRYGAQLVKTVKTGLQQTLLWNPYLSSDVAAGYSAKGLEAMYGKGNDTRDKVLNSPKAFNEFYNGIGKKLRSGIDGAYNWYLGAVTGSGSSTNMNLLSPVAPEQKVPAEGGGLKTIQQILVETNKNPKNPDAIWCKPSIVPTYKELEDHYKSTNNLKEQAKSPSYGKSKKLFDEIAKEIGADANNVARIPLQTWGAKDKEKQSTEMVKQWEIMISTLNSLNPGIQFHKVIPPLFSDHTQNKQHGSAEFAWARWGADYDAAASSIQGIAMNETRPNIIMAQALAGLQDPTSEMYKLIGPGAGKQSDGNNYEMDKDILSKITLKQFHDFAYGVEGANLDPKIIKQFQIGNSLVSKGYLLKSDNLEFMRETAKFMQDHAVYYRPISNEFTTLIASRSNGGASVVIQKKWMNQRIQQNGDIFLQDYNVDLS